MRWLQQTRGLDAIALIRLGAFFERRGLPVAARLVETLVFFLFNSRISTRTEIGKDTRCAYRGMSVLIHEDARIGSGVQIGPHVVIGGRSGQAPPTIENDVYIGANAVILGDITVRRGARIGGGAVVIDDVDEYQSVAGNPARPL